MKLHLKLLTLGALMIMIPMGVHYHNQDSHIATAGKACSLAMEAIDNTGVVDRTKEVECGNLTDKYHLEMLCGEDSKVNSDSYVYTVEQGREPGHMCWLEQK